MMNSIDIRWCRKADEDHERTPRLYAHVFHKRDTICVADSFEVLPQGYRLGILLHELGHLLIGPIDHPEARADAIIFDRFNIAIWRRRYEDKPRLEYIRLKDYSRAKRILDNAFYGRLGSD